MTFRLEDQQFGRMKPLFVSGLSQQSVEQRTNGLWSRHEIHTGHSRRET